MELRRAKAEDLEGIRRLLKQVADVHVQGRPDIFAAGAIKYTDEEILALLADELRPVFVAVREKELLGYAFCIVQIPQSHVLCPIKTLYIDDLCVEEKCRGQHIGKALYEYVLGYGRKHGFYNVTLNVWACNPAAMSFYQSCGLEVQKVTMEKILK